MFFNSLRTKLIRLIRYQCRCPNIAFSRHEKWDEQEGIPPYGPSQGFFLFKASFFLPCCFLVGSETGLCKEPRGNFDNRHYIKKDEWNGMLAGSV